ncbi:hypothetical protein C5167_016477 [Papaver somniferum]|nr:hypothetical protein C5167_016477 [Papaver somniferum]
MGDGYINCSGYESEMGGDLQKKDGVVAAVEVIIIREEELRHNWECMMPEQTETHRHIMLMEKAPMVKMLLLHQCQMMDFMSCNEVTSDLPLLEENVTDL